MPTVARSAQLVDVAANQALGCLVCRTMRALFAMALIVATACGTTAVAPATPRSAPAAATTAAMPTPRPAFAVRFIPPAPPPGEAFDVAVEGLDPGEQIEMSLGDVGQPAQSFPLIADARGEVRTSVRGGPATLVATARRASGAVASAGGSSAPATAQPLAVAPPEAPAVAASRATQPPPVAPATFAPFQCRPDSCVGGFDANLTCSPLFKGADKAVYRVGEMVTYEICLPRPAASITLWWRLVAPGFPFSTMHDLSYQGRSHVGGTVPAPRDHGTWTIRAIVDGVAYDIDFEVSP